MPSKAVSGYKKDNRRALCINSSYRKSAIKTQAHLSLSDDIGFDLIGDELGVDISSAIGTALATGAQFCSGINSLAIFQQTVLDSIKDIEEDERGKLLQRFLTIGPYENDGDIPAELLSQRLSDKETATAIAFVYAFMINHFKGAITELLAVGACSKLLRQWKRDSLVPMETQLFVGDNVAARPIKGMGYRKAADMHFLLSGSGAESLENITVIGVVEVKSYFRSDDKLHTQLNQHITRAAKGLWINGINYSADRVRVGSLNGKHALKVVVMPTDWKLSRSYRFEESEHGRNLVMNRRKPPLKKDEISQDRDGTWQIRLRWSKEAIAEAAYEMTIWFMEKVGEVVYAGGVPKGWEYMSPAEAGQNAVKLALYYAAFRCRSAREQQRAVALFNAYSFGYALGMNFRNKDGKMESLNNKDLDELLLAPVTKGGCYLA